MNYNFTAMWIKGIKNDAADALSRHPCQSPNQGDELAEYDVSLNSSQEIDTQASSISQMLQSATDPADLENLHLQELREHAHADREYQDLKTQIREGFPNQKGSLPEHLKKFWSTKDSLTIDDELIVLGCRLFIPHGLRATLLCRLHEAHQGIARSQARARLTMYWPGIDKDIETFIQGCKHCQDRLPSHPKEPITMKSSPDRPFQQVAADFASYGGREFLITVDCKTDWPDVIEMS